MPRFSLAVSLLFVLCLALPNPSYAAVDWDEINQAYANFKESKLEGDKALELLTLGLDTYPFSRGKSIYLLRRGEVNYYMGNLEQARNDAEQGMALNPGWRPSVLAFLAQIECAEGNITNARDLIDAAREEEDTEEQMLYVNEQEIYIQWAENALSVEELFRQYEANPFALEEKYRDSSIPIRGRITRISRSSEGYPSLYFSLEDGRQLHCTMPHFAKYIMAKLNMGDEISIAGVLSTSTSQKITLLSCKFLTWVQ